MKSQLTNKLMIVLILILFLSSCGNRISHFFLEEGNEHEAFSAEILIDDTWDVAFIFPGPTHPDDVNKYTKMQIYEKGNGDVIPDDCSRLIFTLNGKLVKEIDGCGYPMILYPTPWPWKFKKSDFLVLERSFGPDALNAKKSRAYISVKALRDE